MFIIMDLKDMRFTNKKLCSLNSTGVNKDPSLFENVIRKFRFEDKYLKKDKEIYE